MYISVFTLGNTVPLKDEACCFWAQRWTRPPSLVKPHFKHCVHKCVETNRDQGTRSPRNNRPGKSQVFYDSETFASFRKPRSLCFLEQYKSSHIHGEFPLFLSVGSRNAFSVRKQRRRVTFSSPKSTWVSACLSWWIVAPSPSGPRVLLHEKRTYYNHDFLAKASISMDSGAFAFFLHKRHTD